jgi:hypothetical protein
MNDEREVDWEDEGGSLPPEQDTEESPDAEDPLLEQAKVAWEEPSEEHVEGEEDTSVNPSGVVVGLSPLGPVVQVTDANGDSAQKVVSVEELFLLGGQMIGIASFMMQMGMQAQMQEQARLQQMMQQGEEQTKSGIYVKR